MKNTHNPITAVSELRGIIPPAAAPPAAAPRSAGSCAANTVARPETRSSASAPPVAARNPRRVQLGALMSRHPGQSCCLTAGGRCGKNADWAGGLGESAMIGAGLDRGWSAADHAPGSAGLAGARPGLRVQYRVSGAHFEGCAFTAGVQGGWRSGKSSRSRPAGALFRAILAMTGVAVPVVTSIICLGWLLLSHCHQSTSAASRRPAAPRIRGGDAEGPDRN